WISSAGAVSWCCSTSCSTRRGRTVAAAARLPWTRSPTDCCGICGPARPTMRSWRGRLAPIMFNYRGPDELRDTGFEWMLNADDQPMEQPGLSCFLMDGLDIFHTYSTFGRGTE